MLFSPACLLFHCLAVYSTVEMKKPWLCQTQTRTCKLQLSHHVHYAWFHLEPVNSHQCAHTLVSNAVVIWTTAKHPGTRPQISLVAMAAQMSVISIMGWERGDPGVKPQVPSVCACARVVDFSDHLSLFLLQFMYTHSSYVAFLTCFSACVCVRCWRLQVCHELAAWHGDSSLYKRKVNKDIWLLAALPHIHSTV